VGLPSFIGCPAIERPEHQRLDLAHRQQHAMWSSIFQDKDRLAVLLYETDDIISFGSKFDSSHGPHATSNS
jgi:hypothetical protein